MPLVVEANMDVGWKQKIKAWLASDMQVAELCPHLFASPCVAFDFTILSPTNIASLYRITGLLLSCKRSTDSISPSPLQHLRQSMHLWQHEQCSQSIRTPTSMATKSTIWAKCTNVDKMKLDECKALLAGSMEIDLLNTSSDIQIQLGMLAIRLDGIPLALDLAGARIRDDIDNIPQVDDSDAEGDVVDAIGQYLVDLEEHAKSLLSDPDHIAAKTYKKTIWSVWETVLSSLKHSDQRDPGSVGCTMHLLKLAVVLGPPIVHHEIFRAASQSFVAVSG